MKGYGRELAISFIGSLLTIPVVLALPTDAAEKLKIWIGRLFPVSVGSPKTTLAFQLYVTSVVLLLTIFLLFRWNSSVMQERWRRLDGDSVSLPNPWSIAEWDRIAGVDFAGVIFPLERERTLSITRSSFRIGDPLCKSCGSNLQGSAGRWRFFYRCGNPLCKATVISTKAPLREHQEALASQLYNIGVEGFVKVNSKHLIG